MSFKVIIVSPKEKWEGDLESITLPGQNGELTIFSNHAPIMGKLGEGEITTGSYSVKVKDGFFEFLNNQARILINEK